MTEDEMVGWHHRLDGHEFEYAPGVGDEQRSLVYCSPWGHKESDTTERLSQRRKGSPVSSTLFPIQFSSVAQSCLTFCEPMSHSTPGLPVHHQLPESTKPMSAESVMPSNHLILCRPLLLLPSIIPSIRVFSSDSVFSTGGQSIGASASASVLPMNIQD